MEIIGEATKKIDENSRKKYPEIEWKGMARMRDKLIHDYFGVDYEIIWEVIQERIPELHHRIEYILNETKN